MARSAELEIVESKYSTSVSGDWLESNTIWSGNPSNNDYQYYSRIQIEVGDIDITKSKQLVVHLQLTATSYLGACRASLSPERLKRSEVCNSSYTGRSEKLKASELATCKACNSSGEEYEYSSTTYGDGRHFYFYFDTTEIKPNTTYYVYLIPTSTSKSWLESARSTVTATLTYVSDKYAHISNGDSFKKHVANIHNGTSFKKYKQYTFDGLAWKPYS